MSDPNPPPLPPSLSPAIAAPPVPAGREQTLGMLCHLLALSGLVIGFGNILGPLVMWLVKKDTMPLVDREGRESLNFNISFTIYTIFSAVAVLLLIGILLLPVVFVLWLIFTIVASIKVANGESFRYPLTIRFLK